MFEPDEFSGKKLGRYEVLCRLTVGGMAEIFLAFQRGAGGFQKPVVLKRILAEHREDPHSAQLLIDEAHLCATLTHPNIAQAHDLETTPSGEMLLVMEFIPGATLYELVAACRGAGEGVPLGFSLATIREAAMALHNAHSRLDMAGKPTPIVHRDVAPRNIMVTYDGVTKLLDFGIARAVGAARRTAAGMVRGTTAYMSPEQTTGAPLDPRSDVFSLGVILHELLTGARLFERSHPVDEMRAVHEAAIALPSKVNRRVPRDLDPIVLRALERSIDRRYGTALELVRELSAAVPALIWPHDQCAEPVMRLFAERQELTRRLLRRAQRSSERSPLQTEEATPTDSPPAGAGDAMDSATVPGRPPFETSEGWKKMSLALGLTIVLGAGIGAVMYQVLEARAEPTEPEVAEGIGRLTLAADPNATVLFDGREIGRTPLIDVYMPSGRHTLRLLGPDAKLRLLPIEIRRDGVTKMRVQLDRLAVVP